MNMIGGHYPEMDEEWRDYAIPNTYAGTAKRNEWIGKHTPFEVKNDEYHLHAKYLKGVVQWVLTTRASGICRQEGRCIKIAVRVI